MNLNRSDTLQSVRHHGRYKARFTVVEAAGTKRRVDSNHPPEAKLKENRTREIQAMTEETKSPEQTVQQPKKKRPYVAPMITPESPVVFANLKKAALDGEPNLSHGRTS